jgi:tripartite-type tricarboxylate transporter receptor subunit TctC
VSRNPKPASVSRSIGAEVVASSPEEYGRFIKSELQKWSRLIKESGASAH